MTYLLKGDPKEVEKVIRENRIRVQRGVIEFTPVEPEEAFEVVDEDVATVGTDNVPTPESVPKIEETAGKEGESVLEIAEMPENPADSVPESDNPELMDDKHIGELEDLQEVDLDADDKTPVTDDSKNVPEADVKEAEAPKKASKRSKKSE